MAPLAAAAGGTRLRALRISSRNWRRSSGDSRPKYGVRIGRAFPTQEFAHAHALHALAVNRRRAVGTDEAMARIAIAALGERRPAVDGDRPRTTKFPTASSWPPA
jgi:hypothetical protein